MPQVVRAGAVSHVGRVRSNNQDSGLIGKHIFGVADGMGGHAGGDVASSIAVKFLAEHDVQFTSVDEAKEGLTALLHEANELIVEAARTHAELKGMGTTADLITRIGYEMVIVHIGDSRVYRLHEGELRQVTTDHTTSSTTSASPTTEARFFKKAWMRRLRCSPSSRLRRAFSSAEPAV